MMDFRGWCILLVGCAAKSSASVPAEPAPAVASSAAAPSITAPAAATSAPAAAPSVTAPAASLMDTHGGPPTAVKPETGHDGHGHQHGHGKAGYHMDFSAVERFARHFDGPERDSW